MPEDLPQQDPQKPDAGALAARRGGRAELRRHQRQKRADLSKDTAVRRQMKPTSCEPPGGPHGGAGVPRGYWTSPFPGCNSALTEAQYGASFIVNTRFAQALNQYYSRLLVE